MNTNQMNHRSVSEAFPLQSEGEEMACFELKNKSIKFNKSSLNEQINIQLFDESFPNKEIEKL